MSKKQKKQESDRTQRRHEERKQRKQGHKLVNWSSITRDIKQWNRKKNWISIEVLERENSQSFQSGEYGETTIMYDDTFLEYISKMELLDYLYQNQKQYYERSIWFEDYDIQSDEQKQWLKEVYDVLWTHITIDQYNQRLKELVGDEEYKRRVERTAA